MFKNFVKENPSLVNYVNSDKMTWQKFYEMYDMYGPENEIWNDYIKKSSKTKDIASFDLINWIKNINIDSLQENINSVKRVIGVLEDLKTTNPKKDYQPRPIYKHFED